MFTFFSFFLHHFSSASGRRRRYPQREASELREMVSKLEAETARTSAQRAGLEVRSFSTRDTTSFARVP